MNDNLLEPCKRKRGAYRAHFLSKEQAEAFAADPANWPVYKGDVAHRCSKCLYWHLSRPEWLVQEHQRIMKGKPA
jgi:hypothetical protein